MRDKRLGLLEQSGCLFGFFLSDLLLPLPGFFIQRLIRIGGLIWKEAKIPPCPTSWLTNGIQAGYFGGRFFS